MLIPIRCVVCGGAIGDKYGKYMARKQARVEEKYGELEAAPENVIFDRRYEVPVEDILADLGLDMDCCRKTMVSNMSFRDYN